MTRSRTTSKNLFWGFICRIISLILPFITRSILIYTLGIDYIGLGSLFSSILQVLNLAELGVGSAIVYFMYKPLSQNDVPKVCALLNLYKKTYRIIGFIILGAGLLILPFLEKLIAGEVPAGINLKLLYLIYFSNNLAGYFLFSYKQSIFMANQRVDIISKVNMLVQVFSNILKILILLTLRNYYIYILVIPLITIMSNIIFSILADKIFPQYKTYGNVSTQEKKDIQKKVAGMLFQKIGYIVLSSVDSIVISSFLGLHILGIYNGYYFVITTLYSFIAIIHQALIPAIANSLLTDPVSKNLRDFKKFHFLFMWIISWCCACLLALYQPFMTMWQGGENLLSNGIVLLLSIYFFANKMVDVNWMYREALGLWWESRFIPLISSIVNLILNIVLVKIIGLAGIVISTIVSLTIINFPWSSKVVFDLYFKSKKDWIFYILQTLFYFGCMILISFANLFICNLLPDSGILFFIIKMFICLIIPNIIFLIINLINPQLKFAASFILNIIPQRFLPGVLKKIRDKE